MIEELKIKKGKMKNYTEPQKPKSKIKPLNLFSKFSKLTLVSKWYV